MRKKSLVPLMILLLVILEAPALSALGERGSRIGFGLGTPNAVLIYQPAPFDLRLGYDFTPGNQFLFVSGDWRPAGYIPLTGPLYLYFGLGVYAKVFPEASSENFFEGGTRLPVGLSLQFLDQIVELFVVVAPGFDLYPKPAFSSDPVQFWAGLTFAIR